MELDKEQMYLGEIFYEQLGPGKPISRFELMIIGDDPQNWGPQKSDNEPYNNITTPKPSSTS